MSQDELAEKLEVTRQSISLWETGQTQPSLDNIVALAKLFGVSTDDLLKSNETEASGGDTAPAPKAPKKKTGLLIACVLIIVAALGAGALLLWKGGVLGGKNNVDDSDIPASGNVDGSDDGQTEGSDDKEAPADGDTQNPDTDMDVYGYLKDFVVENGIINGDYCYYSNTADNYGGYESEDFSLYYWGDTDTVEFSLHSVLDDTFSINFYLRVPKTHTGEYEYISSYYYRDSGEALYEARGTIVAKDFTKNYPLQCSKYYGSTDVQDEFMEMSRQGVCDLVDCLRGFVEAEELKYSFEDLGFTKFK